MNKIMYFLFEVRIKSGYTAEQYAEAWLRASRIMQQAEGARGTRLHRKIGEPDVLLAMASWESKALRDRMEANQPDEVREIIAREAAFVDVRVIGEFDDPEWTVDPPRERK